MPRSVARSARKISALVLSCSRAPVLPGIRENPPRGMHRPTTRIRAGTTTTFVRAAEKISASLLPFFSSPRFPGGSCKPRESNAAALELATPPVGRVAVWGPLAACVVRSSQIRGEGEEGMKGSRVLVSLRDGLDLVRRLDEGSNEETRDTSSGAGRAPSWFVRAAKRISRLSASFNGFPTRSPLRCSDASHATTRSAPGNALSEAPATPPVIGAPRGLARPRAPPTILHRPAHAGRVSMAQRRHPSSARARKPA